MNIVLVEDELPQATEVRQQLDKAFIGENTDATVKIYPNRPGLPAYSSMEDFATSDLGQNRDIEAVLVVDLYLVRARYPATPGRSFHQLMYALYPSPVDDSIVCGRLGVLSKLKQTYRNATFVLYTYVPAYFAEANLAVEDDGFVYAGSSLKSLQDHVRKALPAAASTNRGELANTLNQASTNAMRQAIYERIAGIFGVPVPGERDPADGSWPVVEKRSHPDDFMRLVDRIRKPFPVEAA